MNGARELKKNLTAHAVLGALFALLLFCVLLLSGYRDSLVEAEDNLVRIRRNLVTMKESASDLRGKRAMVGRVIPAGYKARSNRELILRSVERARENIAGAHLTVTGFVEENGELSLPVTLEFPVYSYNDAVKTTGYLEGLGLPYFKPMGLTLIRTEGTGKVVGRVEGSFRMPSARIAAGS